MDKLLISYWKQALDTIGEEFSSPDLSRVSFEFVNNSGNNIATINEWAEITLFFNHAKYAVAYSPDSNNSEEKAKLLLNEMRPVLLNEKDSIHYNKIILIAKQMISGYHKTKTIINVIDANGMYLNDEYIRTLRELAKHIKSIISKSDLDYVYNRLLQHSALEYQERYLQDFKNGLVKYILIKNAIIVSYIAGLLTTYLQPLLMFYVSATNS